MTTEIAAASGCFSHNYLVGVGCTVQSATMSAPMRTQLSWFKCTRRYARQHRDDRIDLRLDDDRNAEVRSSLARHPQYRNAIFVKTKQLVPIESALYVDARLQNVASLAKIVPIDSLPRRGLDQLMKWRCELA